MRSVTVISVAKPIAAFTLTLAITISFVLLNHQNPIPIDPKPMARSFILWLHGLGDSGPANEPIKSLFTSPEFRNTKWLFPSAPNNPVTCNCKFLYSTRYLFAYFYVAFADYFGLLGFWFDCGTPLIDHEWAWFDCGSLMLDTQMSYTVIELVHLPVWLNISIDCYSVVF